MTSAPPLELRVGGERFAGFESGQVSQSFDAQLVASTFTIAYATRAGEDVDPVLIEAGDLVELLVGDERLFEGHVADDSLEYDATQQRFQVAGLSRLGDLIECSAFAPSRRFHDVTVFELAQRLLAGYHVEIDDRAVDNTRLSSFAIQEGESIADCLGRAARLRGLVLSDGAGRLVIGRVGAERTETVIDRRTNVLRGSRRRSWRQRFSEYRFTGQTRATDELYGLDAAQIGHQIEDREVTRLRRLSVVAHADRRTDIGRRAIFERNQRAGRSERLTYELAGWTNAEGLWRPNVRVRVVDDWAHVEAELLVVRVIHQFSASPARYRTTVELTRPEAFDELDYPLRGRGNRWR